MKTGHLFLALLLCISSVGFAQEGEVTGKVTDQDERPIAGVNIFIKGTTYGTQTDAKGAYELVATKGDVLVFSHIDTKTIEKTIESTEMDIKLDKEDDEFGEVIRIGHHSTTSPETVKLHGI